MRTLVLDTNIVLDLFVFDDQAARPVLEHLSSGQARWLATGEMREEFARVLDYPQIAARLVERGIDAADVLARFDGLASICAAAAPSPASCADADDQKFIDLASAHGATLLSKDACVLVLARRLAALGVTVARTL